ncbi:MAG: c-type cytochrome [Planctomycetales bacterium]|nr:c-type cytochrome [Planctomycetales bacterium]
MNTRCVLFVILLASVQSTGHAQRRARANPRDARNTFSEGSESQLTTEDFTGFGIYENSAPLPATTSPSNTQLPLNLKAGQRIALIGNTLFDRAQHDGHFEAYVQASYPDLQISVRNLAWSADGIDLQPRPANFASTFQHLTHEKADIVFAAFGFNESFAGSGGIDQFRASLTSYLQRLKSSAFNGASAPQVVLVSPTANENVQGVPAADLNNARLEIYVAAMREVSREQQVGFIDLFSPTLAAMQSPDDDLTINGVHLNAKGQQVLADILFQGAFQKEPAKVSDQLLSAVVDKNRHFFRRFRPLNTFYYTGGRNKSYGYLDFLPAMKNFDILVENRQRAIWKLAQGEDAVFVDDSNVPPLPNTLESRGANEWLSADEELKAFQIDPRFEVNLFAGEEQFPDIAAPIQMRWDNRGRLWVSCSTTYPHVYPGNEPNDKLVILEDTDGDGRADKSTVFADDLSIPLSFEFGNGGVYVSEMPHLTFLKDTDGDDRADQRTQLLTGFGTEDSHHALHDIAWTPDGDLIFRESIFHHSQVETAYGPVRQQNSGWFRFSPFSQRLISFGTYPSTNPWGVTFDDWGQHVASHPIYAAAFHSLDPEYPTQHPRPGGLQAYSGTCGQEFVDFETFPQELQGGFIKVRYKPTNRVEIHRWQEDEFGFQESYVSDLLFSTNLSFIPVDVRFGPRGALYVCDWYNPVKGHAQYSLRDERRDRHSGRIWRIKAKDQPVLATSPQFAQASVAELLDLLQRREYRYRYWAKRELRERNRAEVLDSLGKWTENLDAMDPRYRHHQLEALWLYRWLGEADLRYTATQLYAAALANHGSGETSHSPRAIAVLRELLTCEIPLARAAATQQLRYWHPQLNDAVDLLRRAANDENAIVRMEAAIAATYVGSRESLEAILDVTKYPLGGHLEYALACALGSHSLKPYWESDSSYGVATLLQQMQRNAQIQEPTPSASQAQFDSQANLKSVEISCVPERMLFTLTQFVVQPEQPVKVVFSNPDATDHNWVLVQPGTLADVGMAANEMAKDPRNANSDFIPLDQGDKILHWSPMIGPNRGTRINVLRFTAPSQPGIYPYVCTFPGHWVIMNGVMIVAETPEQAEQLLAASEPTFVRRWSMLDFNDFAQLPREHDEASVMRGMQAFVKAKCNQCHVVAGHGVNLGPDLVESAKRWKGQELLQQILQPSHTIHKDFVTHKFLTTDGRVIAGVIVEQGEAAVQVATNLLTPNTLTRIQRTDIVEQVETKVSAMPEGLVDTLTREEIIDLVTFLETGEDEMPGHLNHGHQHGN